MQASKMASKSMLAPGPLGILQPANLPDKCSQPENLKLAQGSCVVFKVYLQRADLPSIRLQSPVQDAEMGEVAPVLAIGRMNVVALQQAS